MQYDVVIVGARCAGSSTGMLLARRGYRVCVVDRASFPSDALSTHVMTGDSASRMAKWGLLPALAASGCPPLRAIIMAIGSESENIFPAANPLPTFAPRRTVLDKLLVDAAREAGAEVIEHFSVRSLVRDGDVVTGIRGVAPNGEETTIEARFVIGADGRNSLVAREVAAETYDTIPQRDFIYYSYWSGFSDLTAVRVNSYGNHLAFAFPTHDNLACIGVAGPHDELAAARADSETWVLKFVRGAPMLGPLVQHIERVEPMTGWTGYTSYYRKPYGPGWALVGDAGYLKGPALGQGINDAFRDADRLTDALDSVLCGQESFDVALAGYQHARDEPTRNTYHLVDLFERCEATIEDVRRYKAANEARIAAALSAQPVAG